MKLEGVTAIVVHIDSLELDLDELGAAIMKVLKEIGR